MSNSYFSMDDPHTLLLLAKAERLLEMIHLCFVIDSPATASLDFDEICEVMSGARLPAGSPANPAALRDAICALKVHVITLRANQIGMPLLLKSP